MIQFESLFDPKTLILSLFSLCYLLSLKGTLVSMARRVFVLLISQIILESVPTGNQLADYGKMCGVSQDSILGTLLFLVHVNNMPQAVKSNLFLYDS